MSKISPFFSLLLFFTIAHARVFNHILQNQSTAFYQCYKGTGMDKVTLLFETKANGLDPASVQNVVNAKNAGLQVQLMYTPCRKRTPQQQLALISPKIQKGLISKIWIFPYISPYDQCSWNNLDIAKNCQYLQQFIGLFHQYYGSVGVVAIGQFWKSFFGKVKGCPQASTKAPELLWIPFMEQNDGKQNFDSYYQIGGWTKPYARYFTTSQKCGKAVQNDYYQ